MKLALVGLFFVFISSMATAQVGGPAPRNKARLILEFASDTLGANSSDPISGRLNDRQRFVMADFDFNLIKSEKYLVTIGALIESLNTGLNNFQIGENNTDINNFLTNQVFEVSGTKMLGDQGRVLGVSLSYGSASDNPFGRERDSAINLTGRYGFNKKEKSQWFLIANYSNNRAFLNNIPLPSFLYLYMPSKFFVAPFGFPFLSFRWMDYKSYAYSLFLTPSGAGFDFAWRVFGPAMFYTKFNFLIQTFMHENRINEESRLFYEDKKIEIGLNSFLSKTLKASLGLGYSFGRRIYEGESIFNVTSPKKDLAEDIYLKANLTINY